MGYLLIKNDGTPVEYRGDKPDDLTGWEEVEPDDPRIAQIGGSGAQWGAFRLTVFDKENEYGRQFHAALATFMETDPVTTSALMTEAGKDEPFVEYLVDAWNLLVAASHYAPPAGATNAWSAIAIQTKVPLRWLPNGRLERRVATS